MAETDSNTSPEPNGAGARNAVVIALAVLAVVAAYVAIKVMREAPVAGPGGAGGGPMAMPPAAVYVESVAKETTQAEAIVTGELRAVSQADIAAREPGAVMEVLVDEGSVVKEGDVVAKLDDRRIAAQLNEAEAVLKSANSLAKQRQAELDRAKRDFSMKRGLLERKAVSESDALDAERALAVADAQRDVARDGIAEAESRIVFLKAQLADLTIRASFDGVIVSRRTEPGEWAAAGAVVAALVTVDPIEAWLRVPSRHLDDLRGNGEGFRVRRSATGELLKPSSVKLIPDVDPNSQLFTVVATLPNDEARLAPGESVTGIVPVGRRSGHWLFPTDALIRSAAGDFVYVVQPPGNEGEMPSGGRTMVDIAFERGGKVYIADPETFSEGDQVIVEGNERLMPGQGLMIQSRGEPAAPPAP